MGKKTGGRKKGMAPVTVYGSDDERAYTREPVPDATSDDFFHDDVDQFHMNREKILLDKGADLEPTGFSSDEQEEVLGLGLEDDSDEEIAGYHKTLRKLKYVTSKKDELGSDIEEDEDLSDEGAWGNRKSKYYGADVDDDDIDISGSEGEEGTAALEEKEALALQRKMAEQLDEEDFGLDIFKSTEKGDKDIVEGERVVTDLSKLSKREKLELLQKQSPELLELIDDYVVKMTNVKDVLQPLRHLIRSGKLPTGKAADYVNTKFRLCLNYCVNISFYMILKAKCTPVENHPVIKRILQYRNLIKQLEPLDTMLKPEIDAILDRVRHGKEIEIQDPEKKSSRKPSIHLMKGVLKQVDHETKKKKLSEMINDEEDNEEDSVQKEVTGGSSKKKRKSDKDDFVTKDEKEALEYYEMMKSVRKRGDTEDLEECGDRTDDEVIGEEEGHRNEVEEEEDYLTEDGKRAITYQMAKNKGLTPYRKKELKNPRVKHRIKYRKAKIRRKGMIRESRTEMNPYGGELSGIRAGVKRSVKLK